MDCMAKQAVRDPVEDARDYLDYILNSHTWGHGPLQVAEAVKDALDGKGIPFEAMKWHEEGRPA